MRKFVDLTGSKTHEAAVGATPTREVVAGAFLNAYFSSFQLKHKVLGLPRARILSF